MPSCGGHVRRRAVKTALGRRHGLSWPRLGFEQLTGKLAGFPSPRPKSRRSRSGTRPSPMCEVGWQQGDGRSGRMWSPSTLRLKRTTPSRVALRAMAWFNRTTGHTGHTAPPEPEVEGGAEMDYFHRLHEFTCQAQAGSGVRHKRAYDTRCQGQDFAPGNRVWIYCPSPSCPVSTPCAARHRSSGRGAYATLPQRLSRCAWGSPEMTAAGWRTATFLCNGRWGRQGQLAPYGGAM
ncbi:hypothetical protein AAFF_G00362410 [Aldrovandia affinis]|uniref:Uncharacterized protein n=1 Tax=Aldrovandia affinis TaxID=143900 RepID=A0AAD7WN17_9TELE|nr:hypothetical protein AAFF_G00362410 [Aldrovandia affinis]